MNCLDSETCAPGPGTVKSSVPLSTVGERGVWHTLSRFVPTKFLDMPLNKGFGNSATTSPATTDSVFTTEESYSTGEPLGDYFPSSESRPQAKNIFDLAPRSVESPSTDLLNTDHFTGMGSSDSIFMPDESDSTSTHQALGEYSASLTHASQSPPSQPSGAASFGKALPTEQSVSN